MARTTDEIFDEILRAKTQDTRLDALNSTSKVAVWRLWAYITAFAIWTLEMIFDTHRADMEEKIRTQKVFSLPWYRNMALRFQHGFSLVYEKDYYDNTGVDEQLVEASKIVKYSAINEVEGVLILKIATEKEGELNRITNDEEKAFTYYMNRIKAGGVEIRIINAEADLLNIDMAVYYDPLLMRADGNLIQPTGDSVTPVERAVRDYLKKLPFNGELVLAHLTDYLQKVTGVAIPEIYLATTKWVDDAEFQPIDVKVIPNSGYFKLNQLNVEYVANI